MDKTPLTSTEFTLISNAFQLIGDLESLSIHKRGHIHDTYISTWSLKNTKIRYIHQKINQEIFRDVPGLLKNIEIVTEHLPKKIAELGLAEHDLTLSLLKSENGSSCYKDHKCQCWRTYRYLENTYSYEVCTNIFQAQQAALILGRFQRYLLDLDNNLLIETIPNFLSSSKRYAALVEASNKDLFERASTASAEIEFAQKRSGLMNIIDLGIKDGTIPLRIVHGDMKLNNVLFSESSSEAICLVDLDTCMPGYSLFDFGDLARNTTIPTAEDEQDFSKVQVDLDFFRALVKGYLKFTRDFLLQKEIELIPIVPRLLALTLGVRFLTDYLQGDTYFKIDRPLHNLERARTQFTVVERMEVVEDKMRHIVNEVLLS